MYYILKAKCTAEYSTSLSETAVPRNRYETEIKRWSTSYYTVLAAPTVGPFTAFISYKSHNKQY
jgi:hypothetical protein